MLKGKLKFMTQRKCYKVATGFVKVLDIDCSLGPSASCRARTGGGDRRVSLETAWLAVRPSLWCVVATVVMVEPW